MVASHLGDKRMGNKETRFLNPTLTLTLTRNSVVQTTVDLLPCRQDDRTPCKFNNNNDDDDISVFAKGERGIVSEHVRSATR